MSNPLVSALRSVGAVVAGYLVIVVGTTLTFETLLGGISYRHSSPGELALASLGAVISGLAGGLATAWLAGRRPLLHAAAIVVPIALDTWSVLALGKSQDPVWFDLGGAATLVLGAVAAGWWFSRRRQAMA